MINKMFDLHILTGNSTQGHDKVAFLCENAVAKNLRAVAFCDHFDLNTFDETNSARRIRHSYFDTAKAKIMFFDSILVLSGIETEQAVFNKDMHNHIISAQNYDMILTSIHKLPDNDDFCNLSRISTDGNKLFNQYIDALIKTVYEVDFDVLSQILYPLRYIEADLSSVPEKITQLLYALAEKNKALEIDTRDIMGSEKLRNFYLKVLCEYKKCGGNFITIGSEAYYTDDVGYGIDIALNTVKRADFSQITLYENRVPYTFTL